MKGHLLRCPSALHLAIASPPTVPEQAPTPQYSTQTCSWRWPNGELALGAMLPYDEYQVVT